MCQKRELSLNVCIFLRRTVFHHGLEGETCIVWAGGSSVSMRAGPSLPLGLTQSALGKSSMFHCPSALPSVPGICVGRGEPTCLPGMREDSLPAVFHVFDHFHLGLLVSPGPWDSSIANCRVSWHHMGFLGEVLSPAEVCSHCPGVCP